MKKSLTLAAVLAPLTALPAFAHTDGTAHVHSTEGLAWAIGIGLVAGLAYFAARGRR